MTLHCSVQCQEMLIPSKQTGRQMQKNLHCLFEDNCVACFCFCIRFCFCPLQRFQFAIIAAATRLVSASCFLWQNTPAIPWLESGGTLGDLALRTMWPKGLPDRLRQKDGDGFESSPLLIFVEINHEKGWYWRWPWGNTFLQPNQICDRKISIASVKINTSLQMMRELPVSVSSPFCQSNSCTIFNLNLESFQRPTLVLLALNLVSLGTLEWCFEWNVSLCSQALSSYRANYPSRHQNFLAAMRCVRQSVVIMVMEEEQICCGMTPVFPSLLFAQIALYMMMHSLPRAHYVIANLHRKPTCPYISHY